MWKNPFGRSRIVAILLIICLWCIQIQTEWTNEQILSFNNAANAAMWRDRRDSALIYNQLALRVDSANSVLLANRALYLLMDDQAFGNPRTFTEGPDTILADLSLIHQTQVLFKEASILTPHDPVFIHNMGWLYLVTGNIDSAQYCFHRVLELAPHNPVFLLSMGMFEEQRGNETDAITYYGQAIAIAPDLLNTPFFQDLSHRIHGGASAAVSHAVSILENEIKKQRNYGTKSRKAKLSLYLGDSLIAMQLLKDVTANYPNLNRSWLMLGNLTENRDTNLALVYYKKAQVLDMGDPLPFFYLARMYDALGDYQLARDYKQQGLLKKANARSGYVLRSQKIYQAQIWYNELYPSGLKDWLSSAL